MDLIMTPKDPGDGSYLKGEKNMFVMIQSIIQTVSESMTIWVYTSCNKLKLLKAVQLRKIIGY